MTGSKTITSRDLQAEIDELKLQLEEANDTIEAIRTGQVDALVVKSADGHQLYTLKSADQTYRVFIEKMNEGAITLNKEGIILYCNSRFAKMVNIDLSKVVGMEFIDLVSDEQKNEFENIIQHAWEVDIKGEVQLKKAGDGNTPFLFSINTLELDDGMALSVILADLTQQKEIEKELKDKNKELEEAKQIAEELNNVLEYRVNERTRELLVSREHFKFLADNIPVIAWTAAPDGQMTYFNKRWYEYTGMTEGEDALKKWPDVIHDDEREMSVATWKKSMATAEPFRMEYKIKRGADDVYRWHYGNALPYKNEQGEIVAWFGIATDIDFQKKALEQKDEFINMISHELKTPVTSLKGFTQLMMMTLGNAGPAVNGYLSTMNNQINKLTRLITDLLDATKFNNGMLKYDEDNFDFNSLVKEISGEMQFATDTHTIQLQLCPAVEVCGDKNRIGQVMTNLISNAIKYSPNATSILISSEIKDNNIVFCVKDYGIGISKDQQALLYTRFYRVQENNGNSFPGMGLGLYISMEIIQKHNGKMWVDSELDKGACFYFSLPLKSC